MLPSPYGCGLGPRGSSLSRLQRVHFCYGPVTRDLPVGDLVDRLRRFGFPPLRYPNYGALTSTPAGLSPAEHASLRWTHNHSVRLPRRTRAASYSGQFVTRYLALGNLWRRLSWNLYGMGFQNYDNGTTGPPYRPDIITAIRSGILRPRRTGQPPGQGDGTSLDLLPIRAPTRFTITASGQTNRCPEKSGAAHRKLYGEIGPAFYGLRTTLLTLLLMALLRIKRPEHLKDTRPSCVRQASWARSCAGGEDAAAPTYPPCCTPLRRAAGRGACACACRSARTSHGVLVC